MIRKKEKVLKRISDTMQAYPEIIASHDFICTVLLEDENIIAKGGAQGVYCLALKEEKNQYCFKGSKWNRIAMAISCC